jgi:hypothetical protein
MKGDSTRAELLNALSELGGLFPEWRLGQTLANLAMAAGHGESSAVWDLEDSEALTAARRLIERNIARKEPNPSMTPPVKSAHSGIPKNDFFF